VEEGGGSRGGQGVERGSSIGSSMSSSKSGAMRGHWGLGLQKEGGRGGGGATHTLISHLVLFVSMYTT